MQIIEVPITSDTKIAVPHVEFNGQKVMTTELLAQIYGCSVKNIHDNFSNNKEHFEIEKHFFKLVGADLKDFINQYNSDCNSILSGYKNINKMRSFMLWTKRGAILISKILGTKEAWNIQEKLVDIYFEAQDAKKEETKSQEYSKKSHQKYLAPIQDALAVADFLTRSLRMSETSIVNMTSKICTIYNVDSSFLPEYIEQQPVSSLSKLLEDFNLTHLGTAHKLNLILEEHGILEKITRKSTKTEGKIKTFWSLTSKGLEWGKNEVYPPNPRETQPLYFRDKFMNLLKQLQIV